MYVKGATNKKEYVKGTIYKKILGGGQQAYFLIRKIF